MSRRSRAGRRCGEPLATQPASQIAAEGGGGHRALALSRSARRDQLLGSVVGHEVGADVMVGGHRPPSSGDRGFRLLALRSAVTAALARPRCVSIRASTNHVRQFVGLVGRGAPARHRQRPQALRRARARAPAAGAVSRRTAASAQRCPAVLERRRSGARRPPRRGCRGWPARPPSARPPHRSRRPRGPPAAARGTPWVRRRRAAPPRCGPSSRPTRITAPSAITTTAIAPISQTHSNAAAVMKAARPPAAAAIQIRMPGGARSERTTAMPEQEREQSDEQREADDPGLCERLEVQRVRVANEAGGRAIARPPELERARPDALPGCRGVGVQRRLPVLVAAVAVDAVQAAEDVVLGARSRRCQAAP